MNYFCYFRAASSEATVRSGNEGFDTLETIPDAVPSVLTEPPIEEQLAWHTLWPESHKLYGHGNELFSLCCDHQGKLVASSCKVLLVTRCGKMGRLGNWSNWVVFCTGRSKLPF